MQTLTPDSTILCETPQTLIGNATPETEEESEGKIGDGRTKPQPLQGGSDRTEQAPGRQQETGAEGDGP
jgi:hypothetical protein